MKTQIDKVLDYEQAMRGDGEPIPHQYDIFDQEGVIATCWDKSQAAELTRRANAHAALVAALETARASLQRQVLNGTCGASILETIDAALALAAK
jgi:hypothetical protein